MLLVFHPRNHLISAHDAEGSILFCSHVGRSRLPPFMITPVCYNAILDDRLKSPALAHCGPTSN